MTLEEIKNDIEQEVNTNLPQLNSTSSTSIFKIWINAIAGAIFSFKQLFEADKAALIELTERRRYGTVEWYATECLKFQLGDQLVFNSTTGQFYYAVIDENIQIVKRSAVIEDSTSGALVIKVAKLSAGNLTPLNPSEIVAFQSYVNEIKVAGTDIDIVSLQPDIINIVAEIFYDGNILEVDLQNTITSKLTDFKENAPFNGVVLKNDLIEVLRNIDGIDDVLFTTLTGQSNTGLPSTIVRNYNTSSGYFEYPVNMINTWTFTPRFV